jgi:hypothetical protein
MLHAAAIQLRLNHSTVCRYPLEAFLELYFFEQRSVIKRRRRKFSIINLLILLSFSRSIGNFRLQGAGITPTVYDKNAYYGGHTASFRYENNFVFDNGPHISFTKDPRIQDLFCGQHRSAVRECAD